jgi:hypothetical protein
LGARARLGNRVVRVQVRGNAEALRTSAREEREDLLRARLALAEDDLEVGHVDGDRGRAAEVHELPERGLDRVVVLAAQVRHGHAAAARGPERGAQLLGVGATRSVVLEPEGHAERAFAEAGRDAPLDELRAARTRA